MLLRPLCDSQQTNNHPEASFTCWWGWFGLLVCRCVDGCFGGHSGGETPGLIPNPEAKPSSADGTALGRVWESRTPPDSTLKRPTRATGWAFFVPESRPNHARTRTRESAAFHGGTDLLEQRRCFGDRTVREHRQSEASVVGPATHRQVSGIRLRRSALHRAAQFAGVHLVDVDDGALIVGDQVEGGVEVV